MKNLLSLLFSLVFCTLSQEILLKPATAQVTPDGTTNTTVDVSGNDFTIQQGDRAGGNLFHSFGEFSVSTGGSAFFNNAADIVNIFSRVTGGNISNIDGLLGANGAANLFLINPAGIIFGESARLSIGGSFFGSTADSIVFPDGEFSATDLANPPLITINAPIGLNLRDNPGDIVNSSGDLTNSGLEVRPGKNITLVGGDLNFEGGILTALGGNVELGGLSEAGKIGINQDGSLSFPDGIARSDVSLQNISAVVVRSGGGGNITVNARNFELQGSAVFAGIAPDLGSPDAQAGDITINATDNVTLDGQGNRNVPSINNSVYNNSLGNAGKITISARNISLTNGGRIFSFVGAGGKGNSSDITLNARENVSIDGSNDFGPSDVRSFISPFGQGNSGSTNITAEKLSLTNGGQIISFVSGVGDSADINLDVTDSISVNGEAFIPSFNTSFASQINSSISEPGIGNSGDINVTTSKLSLTNGALILTLSSGQGNAGSITINASSTVSFDAANVSSRVGETAVGNAGNIALTANNLSLTNNGQISTETRGEGNAGNLTIDASDSIEVDGLGSGLFSRTGGIADAGNVTITTPELRILDSGQISANNFITETLEISPEGILIRNILEQPIEGSGNAGTIDITANNITLEDRGGIVALSSAGEGGDIQLQVDDLLSLRNNSEISTTAGVEGTSGNGGNININSKLIVAFPDGNNDITANAFDGVGGNITIFTEGVFGIEPRSSTPPNNTNDIDASGETDGIVEIITPDVNPVQVDTDLPNNLVESEQTYAQACQSSQTSDQPSGLTVKGKGGVPPAPIEPFASDPILVDEQINPRNLQAKYPEIKPIKTSMGDIYPARGIIKTEDGKIILTSYPTDNINPRTPHKSANCTPS